MGAKVGKILHAGFGERMKPPEALEAVVAAGRLGRKNGKGFYTYGEGKKKRGGRDASTPCCPGGRRAQALDRGEMAERLRRWRSSTRRPAASARASCAARATATSARSSASASRPSAAARSATPTPWAPARWWRRWSGCRQQHGDRFEPAPLLVEKAKGGGTFY